jgi:N-acetylmuramoyl-L-alanine amidase
VATSREISSQRCQTLADNNTARRPPDDPATLTLLCAVAGGRGRIIAASGNPFGRSAAPRVVASLAYQYWSAGCYPFAMHHPVGPRPRRRLFPSRTLGPIGPTGAALLLASFCCFLSVDAPSAWAVPNLAGAAVFLDPGHNGANDSSIARQVPNGRGGMKPCEAAGAATNSGYPEHSFNWDVVQRIRDGLTQMGVRTQLSRDNDTTLAPCIDQRAAEANAVRPDAIVSIHADSGPPLGKGFHVNYSNPPLNEAQAGPAVQLATAMRDALAVSGLQKSTYVGSGGLYGRADLAGLNLAQYPAVLVELGNMKNADDAAQMQSPEGRARYAAAVTQGIVAYLSEMPSAR